MIHAEQNARPPIIYHATNEDVRSWFPIQQSAKVRQPQGQSQSVAVQSVEQVHQPAIEMIDRSHLVAHANHRTHQASVSIDPERSAISQPELVPARISQIKQALQVEHQAHQSQTKKVESLQQATATQTELVFNPLNIQAESWNSLQALAASDITPDVALSLIHGGHEEINQQLTRQLHQVRQNYSIQTLHSAAKLDVSALRTLGFDALASTFAHKPRLQSEAQSVVRTVIHTLEHQGDIQTQIHDLIQQASQSESARWPVVFVGIESALLITAAASKDKRIKQACIAAALALSMAGCATTTSPKSTQIATVTALSEDSTATLAPVTEIAPTIVVATETVVPTLTSTITPTLENPINSIPVEWKGKINRLDKLPDGRTVAIQKSENPDQPSLLRVLQLDSNGEWISYVPQRAVDYAYNESYGYRGIEWLESLPIPEVSNPIRDINGEVVPMGAFKIKLNEDTDDYYFSGIIGGIRENVEQKIIEWAIFLPTETGDYQVGTHYWANYPEQKWLYGTMLGWKIDGQKLKDEEYTFPELIQIADSGAVLRKSPKLEQPVAQYFLSHNMVGTQIIVHYLTPQGDKYASEMAKLKDILDGNSNPKNGFSSPRFSGWMIPESMEDILDN